MLKKRKRLAGEIPTASMADIAFLLLIFFLVTTTIDVDTGILMQLPPPLDENQKPPPIKERNMLAILVNAQGDILVENEITRLPEVRREVVRHVTNNGVNPKYSEDAEHAIVSLKTDRKTNYDVYIDVLDEVWMGYREIWDGEARKLGFTDYGTYQAGLGEDAVDVVKEKVKAKISLAEPDAG
ncbi:MAG TPA: biopolymer transporter ExbD [Rhodothermia bacterium]|nr:biopolymer transporter ExbD [Rhodothermia bacterium]